MSASLNSGKVGTFCRLWGTNLVLTDLEPKWPAGGRFFLFRIQFPRSIRGIRVCSEFSGTGDG